MKKSVNKSNSKKRSKINWKKPCLYLVYLFLLIFPLFFFINNGNGSRLTKQQSHSNLINTKEIAKLSVCEFVYNGIAQKWDENVDKEKSNPDYNVLYKSSVKVSVDANSISYNFDDKNKIITFSFSEFTVENPVIDLASISFIPTDKKDLSMNEVIALCRDDASTEAKKSEKLLSSAKDNLQSIIEAWYSPIFQGYSFEYDYDSAEGGEIG